MKVSETDEGVELTGLRSAAANGCMQKRCCGRKSLNLNKIFDQTR